jgi:hypothetical protein
VAVSARDIRLTGVPSTATIHLDRKRIAGAVVHVPLDGRAHLVWITADGFFPSSITVDAKTPTTLAIKLKPKPISL